MSLLLRHPVSVVMVAFLSATPLFPAGYLCAVFGQDSINNGPFSAIAAGSNTWEIVGRHDTLDGARQAAIEACNRYADNIESACYASTAKHNNFFFAAGNCGGAPYTSASEQNCTEAISLLKEKASRDGKNSEQCNIFACEQGGGPWPHGRY